MGARARWTVPPRLRPDRLLEHPLRLRVLRAIEDDPGVRMHHLAARLGRDYHAVRYHVERLEEAGLIHAVGRRRLYAGEDAPTPEEEALFNPAAREVYRFVASRHEVAQGAVPVALGLAPSTVSEAASRLVQAGLLERERQGRRAVLRATAPAR